MRIIFMGTPEAAVPPLLALGEAGHDIALVVTQPDRGRSRGGKAVPNPVRYAALHQGLRVLAPEQAVDVRPEIASSGAELGVVVAYGQILAPALLASLPSGFVNLHFSLLPRWRGAAPVERALMAGDTQTGVCLIRLEAGLDTGPIYASRIVPIDPHVTAGELRVRLVTQGTNLLVAALEGIPTATPTPQTGEATYAEKLSVGEFEIDWNRPAHELERLIRAGNPRPGTWTMAENRRLKLWRASTSDADPTGQSLGTRTPGLLLPGGRVATGSGMLHLEEVQPEGRGPMAASAWLAGLRNRNLILGSTGSDVVDPKRA